VWKNKRQEAGKDSTTKTISRDNDRQLKFEPTEGKMKKERNHALAPMLKHGTKEGTSNREHVEKSKEEGERYEEGPTEDQLG